MAPFLMLAAASALADPVVDSDTGAAAARQDFGIDGTGVVVCIIDRGIDYEHPDFRNADGTTRILAMLDQSGQSYCDGGNPAPVEYTREQINQALVSGVRLGMRDAVGHGTATAGLAAGNGRASGGQYTGLAPGASLIVIKITSDGAFASFGDPAELPFYGCQDQALDWLRATLAEFGEPPCVALINSGVQWGPIDGTSAASRKIDEVFGTSRPGRIYIAASGDEGGYPTHSRVSFSPAQPANFEMSCPTGNHVNPTMWYSGPGACSITIEMDDGTTVGPVPPGQAAVENGIAIYHYWPGLQFYPWTSIGPDFAVAMSISGHTGTGRIIATPLEGTSGLADLFAAEFGGNIIFTSHLVPGRLTDYAASYSAISIGCHVVRDCWIDFHGQSWCWTVEGSAGELWTRSSGGPTRDGRLGLDITAPGNNSFTTYAPRSNWATADFNVLTSDRLYGMHGATSASAPIAVGAVALMLQRNATLTAMQVRDILHASARTDSQTEITPNNDWGYGKLDVYAAMMLVPCRADFDGTGFVDLDDFVAFVSAFEIGTDDADFDRSGFVDLDDFVAFVLSFEAGC